MAKKQRKRIKIEEAEVPMSSMIDIVFLLLIYFIVTQKPIIDETLLSVDLPTPGGKPPPKPPQILTVEVVRMYKSLPLDSEKELNTYYLQQRRWKLHDPAAPNDLARQLKSIAKNDREQNVIINCGPNSIHQKLVMLLDSCSEAGLNNISVVDDESIPFHPNKNPGVNQ